LILRGSGGLLKEPKTALAGQAYALAAASHGRLAFETARARSGSSLILRGPGGLLKSSSQSLRQPWLGKPTHWLRPRTVCLRSKPRGRGHAPARPQPQTADASHGGPGSLPLGDVGSGTAGSSHCSRGRGHAPARPQPQTADASYGGARFKQLPRITYNILSSWLRANWTIFDSSWPRGLAKGA